MYRIKVTRRDFLATTSALAAATAVGLFRRAEADEHKSVKARMDTDIGTLDPNTITGGSEGDTLVSVMPGLVEFDIKGDQIGWRASPYVSKIEASDDGLRISFTLKPGFQWTNGKGELSAEDVKYTFERAKKGDWSDNWAALDHVEVTDNYSGVLVSPEEAPRLTQALIDRGYGEDDIRGILGGNFLRVAEQVWK